MMKQEGKRIWAVVCEPGARPRLESVANTLEGFQALVGGYIETLHLAEDLVAVMDEEGLLKNKPKGVYGLYGTTVFVSVKGDEFADIKPRHRRMLMGREA